MKATVRCVQALVRGLARRRGRRPALHPDGLVLSGVLDVLPPGDRPSGVAWLDRGGRYDVTVRWSRAAGLPARLPDGLGLALRIKDAGGPDRPLDLLLTSSGSGPLTRHLPVPRTDALGGPYSTLTSYRFPDRDRVVAAFPDEPGRGLPARPSALARALGRQPARFRLCAAARGEAWRQFATLSVHNTDPEHVSGPSAFDPYAACLPDLAPTSRLRSLREAAYAGSRQGRGTEAPQHVRRAPRARRAWRAPDVRRGGSAPAHPLAVARAQGLFNIVGGLWPVVSLRSFERIYGAKTDRWLQRTSGALLASAGFSMLRAEPTPAGLRQARRIGVGTALTFLTIDLVYVPRRTIPATYLMDAAKEIAWLAAWWRAGRLSRGDDSDS
ncbi:hypothetical protein ABZ318_28470 [Streptomyces sp. NPDC006197]|uniref:hypothetical protein n=1 Tax=Streptomyces sp. NPDC006197 TaxID=3156685 RepID=UPI0033B1D7E9